MACKCKAKERIKEIENAVLDEHMEDEVYNYNGVTYHIVNSLNYIFYLFKLFLLCCVIFILTPLLSFYVMWGVITKRRVVVKTPKFLKN